MFQFTLKDSKFLPHITSRFEVTLSRGEARILTGENGIGKTTLLRAFYEASSMKNRIILGQQKSGEVFFDRKLSTYRKVIENNSTVLHLSLFQEFWKKSGLEGKEDRKLSQLSGGETQILKLISLASSEADIYFFDEPGQSLDREKKKLLNEIFLGLLRKEKSLLIVEHDYSWLPAGSTVTELEIHNSELREKKSWTI